MSPIYLKIPLDIMVILRGWFPYLHFFGAGFFTDFLEASAFFATGFLTDFLIGFFTGTDIFPPILKIQKIYYHKTSFANSL